MLDGGRAARQMRGALAALTWLVAVGCDDSTAPDDADDLAAWLDFYDVPGVSIAIIEDFALASVEVGGVRTRASGEPVTSETRFQAASLSKAVAAVGVVRLAQEGAVSLDQDVNGYLTSWQVPHNAFQATEKVTLRRLLSHTAGTTVHGFAGYAAGAPLPTLPQILDGVPPANSSAVVVARVPGSAYAYSGGGYEVAELVVRDVTGLTFAEYMLDRVLGPVGMTQSTFEQPLPSGWHGQAATGYRGSGSAVPGSHHVYPEHAAAGLWTTASDYARLLIEVQRALRAESAVVLSQESAQVLVTEVLGDYALGIQLRSLHGRTYLAHTGANDGFQSDMLAHPTLGYGIVVLTNSDHGYDLAEGLIEAIGKREGWPGF